MRKALLRHLQLMSRLTDALTKNFQVWVHRPKSLER